MAKTKKKNAVKITSVKKDNIVLKSGVKTTVVNNKKPRQTVKKEDVDNKKNIKVKNNLPKKTVTKKGSSKKAKTIAPKKTVKKVEQQVKTVKKVEQQVKEVKPVEEVKKETLTQDEIIAKRKERNRRKYEKGQKKYRDNQEKKRIIVPDIVEEDKEEKKDKEEIKVQEEKKDKEETLDKEEPIKKNKDAKKEKKEQKAKLKKERQEKRKTNRKTSGFTQTITNIKEISVTKINDVREKTNDKTIPIGKSYDEQTKRSKRLIKEAIFYAILLTIINVLCITFIDYFNFLRLFDVKALNVVVTILLSLIFNFFVAFMVDYFVTNIWLSKRRKKKDGEQNGDNGTIKEEHREDIKNKEGK